MTVKFDKKFMCASKLPLTLWGINNEPLERFADSFGKTGIFGKTSFEHFILYDSDDYIGLNMIWHCHATQNDVRNFVKQDLRVERFDRSMALDDKMLVYLKSTVRADIFSVCRNGVPLTYNGKSMLLNRDNMSIFAHFVGIQDLKESYIACYKHDV